MIGGRTLLLASVALVACGTGFPVVLAPVGERVPVASLVTATANATGIGVDSIVRFESTLQIWVPTADSARTSKAQLLQVMQYAFTHDASPTAATCIWLDASLPSLDPSRMGPPTTMNPGPGTVSELVFQAVVAPSSADRHYVLHLRRWPHLAPHGRCPTRPLSGTITTGLRPDQPMPVGRLTSAWSWRAVTARALWTD